jgi:hypothetical protein
VQAVPCAETATHVPALQKPEAEQSASVVQALEQTWLVPLQEPTPQLVRPPAPLGAGVHVPGVTLQTSKAWLHAALQQKPSTQAPLAQSVPAAHV